jgi:tetratricopeptide (TPR) repeat protein
MNVSQLLTDATLAFRAGRLDESRKLLEDVLTVDHDNQSSLWGLFRICEAQGDEAAAIEFLHRLAAVLPDDISILEAISARSNTPQQLDRVLALYRLYLQRNSIADGHFNYAYLLARAGESEAAIASYLRAIELGAERPEEIELNIATVYSQQLRDDQSAKRHLYNALSINEKYVPAYFNLGCIAEQRGDRPVALAQFSKCLDIQPDYLPALVRLADAQKFSDESSPLLVRLKEIGCENEDPDLHFALGRAFEQCGNYSEALTHFERANSVDRANYVKYENALTEAHFEAIKQNFDAAWLAGHVMNNQNEPVFICGMFRSGSTLVEQILAAHSSFTPAGEREFFPRLIAKHLPEFPNGCASLSEKMRREWANSYQTESERVFGCNTRLTDKRPDNFLYLGLIKALFPRARIILTQRAWRDIAWSIFTTRFGPGQHYATSIESTRHYINLQADLMTHWQSLFGDDIFVVEYEELVLSPKKSISGLLNFLGEPWEDNCLRFDSLKNTVRTESVWQVRQPLYTSSIGRADPYLALRPDLFE